MTYSHSAKITFSLDPGRVLVTLVLAVLTLGVLYGVTKKWEPVFGPDLVRLFDMNAEANLPTWFNAALWLGAALLAFAVYRAHRDHGYAHAGYWLGMVPLLVFLSADEAGMIHEQIGGVLQGLFGGVDSQHLTYPSVLFGLGLLLVVAGLYSRLAIRLSRQILGLFCLSVAVFVSGAAIVESFGALLQSGRIDQFPFGLSWSRMILIEEGLEMIGVALLIYAFLRVLALGHAPYRVQAAVPAGVTEFRGRRA
jgi:hypothetical protein